MTSSAARNAALWLLRDEGGCCSSVFFSSGATWHRLPGRFSLQRRRKKSMRPISRTTFQRTEAHHRTRSRTLLVALAVFSLAVGFAVSRWASVGIANRVIPAVGESKPLASDSPPSIKSPKSLRTDPTLAVGSSFSQVLPLTSRGPGEWTGMPPPPSDMQPTCRTTDDCSFAQACHEGKCSPCSSRGNCLPSETCILDHCVLKNRARCARTADCQTPEICVLSGYSYDAPRNNAEMSAYCLNLESGVEDEESDVHLPDPGLAKSERRPASVDALRSRLSSRHAPDAARHGFADDAGSD
jgi:hypothetical protein